jgi:hypothetical protein
MSAPVQGDGSDRRKEDRWLAGGMAAHPGVPEVLVTIAGILLVIGVSPLDPRQHGTRTDLLTGAAGYVRQRPAAESRSSRHSWSRTSAVP